MKLTAYDLKELGVIDEIVLETQGSKWTSFRTSVNRARLKTENHCSIDKLTSHRNKRIIRKTL